MAIEAIIDILTRPRGKVSKPIPCFLDSVFDRTEIGYEPTDTHPDPLLTDLWGFLPERLPRLNNTFSAEMGRFFDAVITVLFTLGCPEDTDVSAEGFKDLEARHLARPERREGRKEVAWKQPDIIYQARKLLEAKYRFNSYEAKARQIENGAYYRALGYEPVFLHLSPDFQTEAEFLARDWTVMKGEDALDYIRLETGFDFVALLRAVAENPIISARMAEGHDALRERLGVHMRMTFDHADQQSKYELLMHIATDDGAKAEFTQHVWGLDPDQITDRVSEGFSQRVVDFLDDDNADPDRIFDLVRQGFGKLDNENQEILLAELRDLADDKAGLGAIFFQRSTSAA